MSGGRYTEHDGWNPSAGVLFLEPVRWGSIFGTVRWGSIFGTRPLGFYFWNRPVPLAALARLDTPTTAIGKTACAFLIPSPYGEHRNSNTRHSDGYHDEHSEHGELYSVRRP